MYFKNRMRRVWGIAKADFLSIGKNPSTIIFNLLFPLVFIFVLGLMGAGSTTMSIGFTQRSQKTDFYNLIVQNSFFHQVKDDSLVLDKKLQNGKIVAILDIEEKQGFKGALIKIKTSSASTDKYFLFESVLKSQIHQIEEKVNGQTHYVTETQIIQGRQYKAIDFILPGMLGFSLLSAGLFGVAFSFFHLRQQMIFKRMFCTPVTKADILLGQLLSRLTLQLINSIVLVGVGYWFFGFTLAHGWYTFSLLLMLSLFGLISFMNFGFMVSGIAKNDSAIPALTNVISLPQWLLGGSFFSIDGFPEWLKVISKMLPLTNLNDAMRKVSFEGAGMSSIYKELLVLLLWTLASLWLAKKFFKWQP